MRFKEQASEVESISRDQAKEMLMDTLLLGVFEPRVMLNFNGSYVVYLKYKEGRSHVFWGMCNDGLVNGTISDAIAKRPATQEDILKLINVSSKMGRFTTDDSDKA